MNKKLLYFAIPVLLYILTKVPSLTCNFDSTDYAAGVCKYVLVTVAWMIVILYIIHFILMYIKDKDDK